jgi:hypothetical protein
MALVVVSEPERHARSSPRSASRVSTLQRHEEGRGVASRAATDDAWHLSHASASALLLAALIGIAHESLGDIAALTDAVAAVSGHGFEIVPAWQARPPRRLRRRSAIVALIVAALAAALCIGRR